MTPETETGEFPQYLCRMCGRCCRSITTYYTLDELKAMADRGSEEARVFMEIFKPYGSIEEAKKTVPDQIEQVLGELARSEGFDINKVTFYYCPHVTDDNKCGIYEKRPECCRRAPTGPWACMPPGCGFEGWQFEEREKIKKKVRKLKEYLVTAEAIAEGGMIPGENMSIKELREVVEARIKPFERYGARYW